MSMSMREALDWMAELVWSTNMDIRDAAKAAAQVFGVDAYTLLIAYEERP